MIFALSSLAGQAGYALVAVVIGLVCIAAIYRPRISQGRRTTEINIGRFGRAVLSDEAQDRDKPSIS
jgi:hypothetical protein